MPVVSLLMLASLCAPAAADDPVIPAARRTYTIVDAVGKAVPLADIVVTIKKVPAPGQEGAPPVEVPQTITGFTDKFGHVSLPDISAGNVIATARIHQRDYGTARCQTQPAGAAGTRRCPQGPASAHAPGRAPHGSVTGPGRQP